jgi:isopenicillin N synthase-like dioxygenase
MTAPGPTGAATGASSRAFVVPTVDISPYVSGGTQEQRAQVARDLDRACRDVGFIQIVGHGVPPEVTAGLAHAMDMFFEQELEAKKRWIRPAGENRGYSPPKSESLSYTLGLDPVSRMNDFFEAFNVGASAADYGGHVPLEEHYAPNTWPDLPGFEAAVTTYFTEARRVARTLQDAFADALGAPRATFHDASDHAINVLRMNNYALPPGDIELGADLTGMGEHTDFGFVTVLWADQVEGLQVLGTDGAWHDVMPADGALLVNLGDIAARVTNDQWMSTLHRVKPPVVDGRIRRRRSAAFFHDWNADAVIETLASFVGDGDGDGAEQRYEPVTVAEHVSAKLGGSRAGVKNTRADRERARAESAVR